MTVFVKTDLSAQIQIVRYKQVQYSTNVCGLQAGLSACSAAQAGLNVIQSVELCVTMDDDAHSESGF